MSKLDEVPFEVIAASGPPLTPEEEEFFGPDPAEDDLGDYWGDDSEPDFEELAAARVDEEGEILKAEARYENALFRDFD